ncbi:hypothetical protein B5G52_12735 [Pseudoalteromonas sp. A601]|nr:hypothetical protein B5G52_12735 [Pseudoalteromonas sp. A601]
MSVVLAEMCALLMCWNFMELQMSKVLESASESRKTAEKFDLSSSQVFNQICESVKVHSERGKFSFAKSLLKSAVTKEELEEVLSEVKSKGYKITMHSEKEDSWLFEVSW